MPEPFIRLTKSAMTTYVEGRTLGYRFTVIASDAIEMPNEIFVYQRKPILSSNSYTDVFVNIASPADIEEYPVDAPENGDKPFFRLDSIDLIFRSVSVADDGWSVIKADVDLLIETLKYMDNLTITEITDFGSSSSSTGG